jgi:predicted transcriptional regulator
MPRKESVKRKAIDLIEELPAASDWEDIMYQLYVRTKIEAGIAAADRGRVRSHRAVRKRFLRGE